MSEAGLPNATGATPHIIIEAYKQMFTTVFFGTIFSLAVGFLLLAWFLFKKYFPTDGAEPGDPPLIATVLVCGALGAFFSALTRMYGFSNLPKIILMREFSLPTKQLIMYSLTPPVVGAIAALVLYLAFAGGLLEGTVFPKFDCDLKSKNDCSSLGSLLGDWRPKDAASFAKVLVWSFVAGFAERLVPNTLEALGQAVAISNKQQ